MRISASSVDHPAAVRDYQLAGPAFLTILSVSAIASSVRTHFDDFALKSDAPYDVVKNLLKV
jgi:tRNA G26 N,N-dimethylase Trm1